MTIHVLLFEPGGTVRTVPTDFVTASRIVRSAAIAGKIAVIVQWTRSETREWTRLLDAGEALAASISLFEGSCPCTARPTAEKIRCLIPLDVLQKLGDGKAFFLEPLAPRVPQGKGAGDA